MVAVFVSLHATTSQELIEPDISDQDRSHWAFQAVQDFQPPVIKNTEQARNAIDRFVLAGLEKKDLSLMPAAEKRTLIRRLSFDLRGLPPTADEG